MAESWIAKLDEYLGAKPNAGEAVNQIVCWKSEFRGWIEHKIEQMAGILQLLWER